jgi:hypothetical protein
MGPGKEAGEKAVERMKEYGIRYKECPPTYYDPDYREKYLKALEEEEAIGCPKLDS